MILTTSQLNKMIKDGLIQGLPDGYQAKGLCVDLRCDQLFQHYGDANLDHLHRHTGIKRPISASQDLRRYRIRPETYYLAKTFETVHLPDDMAAICFPRSTAFRSGLHISAGFVDPGYEGTITFGLANLTPEMSYIERGFALIQICFFRATEAVPEPYNGIYQGGGLK